MSANHATTAWTFRYLICVNAALLAGGLSLSCIADRGIDTEEELGEAADELTGWSYYWKGTTTDLEPLDMGPVTDRTCVLRGVAGNLSRGKIVITPPSGGELSAAAVGGSIGSGNYRLYGHGGAHVGTNGQPIWYNNPVIAHATCFPTTQNRTLEVWMGPWDANQPGGDPPIMVAELDPANRRQCYLSGLWGVNGAWNSADSYVSVTKVSIANPPLYPEPGWYLDGDLSSDLDAGRAIAHAVCVDFPEGTVFTSGFVSADPGETKTVTITSGPGIKGCALRTIVGAFNQNSWTDGVVINQPSTMDGDWTVTVTNSKSARWACAK